VLISAVNKISERSSIRAVIAVAWLSLALLGCAHQPYPPLPEDVAAATRQGVPTPSSRPQAQRQRSPQVDSNIGSGAFVSEVARREAALPPVSQKVDPLPPDPSSLPAAESRQLDLHLASQTFRYYEDGQLVWSGLISSGAEDHPTPRGSFRVQSKDINKRSGSYTNFFDFPTPMPYAMQFDGPYWVHEGYVPNQPASHGCVRLRYEDAKFVYARMRVGDAVNVVD